jgi:orotidine-5'-phosphate decarboxylase
VEEVLLSEFAQVEETTSLTSINRVGQRRYMTVSAQLEDGYNVTLLTQDAETLLGKESQFACDGLIIGGYLGSDVIKPFLSYCKEGKKDIFVVARTANKSAPELQDLLSGGRLVHMAAADHVNRYGGDTVGKSGYTRVGILAAASAAASLKEIRSKYPKLFMLLDGADYPNANAKNCANAFDKFGHGAVAVVGSSVTAAWKQEENADEMEAAVAATNRMKKNLNRYITIL